MKLLKEPTKFTIGTSNVCNLKCPLCITGIGAQDKPLKFMKFELFTEIIEKIKHTAKIVELYNWGESFLHKDIIPMLELCHKYNLNTIISSNLSLKKIDHILEAIVQYKLHTLIVSFDGINQEDYEKYRIGGDFNLVISNIKKIQNYKTQYNSEYPIIKLQYLKSHHTDVQEEYIKEHYKEFGADEYVIDEMLSIFKNDESKTTPWFSEKQINNERYLDIPSSMLYRKCPFLYNHLIIEQDGSIPPCCFTTDRADDFTIWDRNKSILELYNSKKFVQARDMFEKDIIFKDHPCSDCSVLLSYKEKINA